ncbi:dehydrogenase/reductase SDR family member 7 [Ischnura elegans]|uniref:dehydrogenase/reductase SDR family member 7 n=1 Tax=Ischnura elegans TaxID=197161 RepID=UPI001ED89284|nr:dehydrogenase/reductase SDR family member 7 [Ischnura elegans]
MDIFSFFGIVIFCYLLTYIVLLSFLDRDLGLAWVEKFGKSIGSLKGQVIWITGASSGIGEAMAVTLAKHGARLVISARREWELERVKGRCLEEGQLNVDDILVLPMDMTDFKAHQECFDQVIDKFGRLDILVNNAGRSQRANWEEIESAVDQDMFNLNVFSVISLTRVVVKYFLEREEGGGHVAVTSSIAGLIGVPFSGSYTGAKHALHGYFDSLRAEKIRNRLTVSILCPGPVLTNFLSESFTSRPGEKYGVAASSSDRRLTADRCSYLCCVALANGLREAWIALPPILPVAYMGRYFPNFTWIIGGYIGSKYLLKLRDSRSTIKGN